MIHQLKQTWHSMETSIKKITYYGWLFSFLVCLVSMGVLIAYEITANLDLYYIGLCVFRLSLFFAIEFIICAFAMDTIKKQIY